MNGLKMLPMVAVAGMLAAGCGTDMTAPGPTEAMAQEAPAGAEGPRERLRGPRPGFRGMWRGVPLARLLEQREALGLTAEQVTRLEALSEELQARREALRAGVQEQIGAGPGLTREERHALTDEERAALRARMQARREALQPLMEQFRESQRAAMQQVREILTDEQEAKLRELRPERPEGARERGGGRGPGGPR